MSCAALAGSWSSRPTCLKAHAQSRSATATTRESIGRPCESLAGIQNGGKWSADIRRVSLDGSLIVRNQLCDNQVVTRGLGSAANASKEHTLYYK